LVPGSGSRRGFLETSSTKRRGRIPIRSLRSMIGGIDQSRLTM
jgi:hypothetical protein